MSVTTCVPAFATKAVSGKRTAAKQVRLPGKVFTDRAILLVQGKAGCDEGDDATRFDQAQRFHKEVIMNVLLQPRFLDVAIHYRVVAKRDIGDNEIELILQKPDILKGIVENHVLGLRCSGGGF